MSANYLIAPKDAGTLRDNFSPEFDKRMDSLRSRLYGSYGTAADEAAKVGGGSGAARRALMIAKGSSDAEAAVSDAISAQQAKDLSAQQLLLENARAAEQARQADALAKLQTQGLSEKARQFDDDLSFRRESLDRSSDQYDRDLALRLGANNWQRDYSNRELTSRNKQYASSQQNALLASLLNSSTALGINPMNFWDALMAASKGDLNFLANYDSGNYDAGLTR